MRCDTEKLALQTQWSVRFSNQRCRLFEFDGERWTIVISNVSRINFKTIESKSLLLIDEFENKNKIALWRKNVARMPRF